MARFKQGKAYGGYLGTRETRKGRSVYLNASGVENQHRSGDSRIGQPFELLLNPWAGKRQPGELKHLSTQRKKSKSDSVVAAKAKWE
ncbi:hypothetical protein HPP92_008300 [Vanilla planifolia]|uniref:Uncharacterized protein n=1 Tax=Vanilla planifolia TaxID=51239 RepID=A0A835R291_VANPL|nr:hypothetical protein HPP92_008300 [Vanilla planifolia]